MQRCFKRSNWKYGDPIIKKAGAFICVVVIMLSGVGCKTDQLRPMDIKDIRHAAAIKASQRNLAEQKQPGENRAWKTIASDGIHDPEGPAVDLLQYPGEALSQFPPDPYNSGNQVDWVKTLDAGLINPRSNIMPETKVNFLDLDILMKRTAEMPMVLFPHSKHTYWLDCTNCHDGIFKKKAGATPVNMFEILQGKYCGRCHGAVSFPLIECFRCHSVPREGYSMPPNVPKN